MSREHLPDPDPRPHPVASTDPVASTGPEACDAPAQGHAPPSAGAQLPAHAGARSGARHGLGLWLFVLAWVVLLALGWLGWNRGVLWTRAEEEPTPAEGLEASASAQGPTLASQPRGPAPAARGPVRVQVVDRAGQPLEGVRVRVVSATGARTAEVQPPALSDARGSLTFDDLPYDGSQVALVLAPRYIGDEGHGDVDLDDVDAGDVDAGDASPGDASGPAPGALRAQLGAFVVQVGDDGQVTAGDGAPGLPAGSSLPLESLLGFARAAEALDELRWQGDRWLHVLARAPVRGPDLRLEVDAGLPLEVEVLDDRRGRPVEGAHWLCAPRLAWDAAPARDPTARAHATLAHMVPGLPGQRLDLDVEVEAPAGWVPDWVGLAGAWLHPQARSLRLVTVARPALEVVLAFPPEAQPLPRASAWVHSPTFEVWQGDEWVTVTQASLDGEGRLRLSGAVCLPGEALAARCWVPGRWTALGHAVLGHEPVESVVLSMRVAAWPAQPGGMQADGAAGDEEGAAEDSSTPPNSTEDGGTPSSRTAASEPPAAQDLPAPSIWMDWNDDDPPTQARAWEACRQRLSGPRGPLPLRVLLPGGGASAGALVRAEGCAAPGGMVTWQQADAAGRVQLPDVPSGRVRVLVLGGSAPALLEVEAGPLPRGEQVVSLPAAATLLVQVRGPAGEPLPCATLDLEHDSGLPWIDLQDGVQRLDGLTDVQGRRRLQGLPPGRLTITALLGSRSAQAVVELREGSLERVDLTVPDAALPGEDEATAGQHTGQHTGQQAAQQATPEPQPPR